MLCDLPNVPYTLSSSTKDDSILPASESLPEKVEGVSCQLLIFTALSLYIINLYYLCSILL